VGRVLEKGDAVTDSGGGVSVPSVLFTTEGEKHGLEALRETYRGVNFTKPGGTPSEHHYSATRFSVGGAVIGHDTTEALNIDRTPQHLADGLDMYAMVFHLDGHSVYDDKIISTGDLEFQDFTEPYKGKFSDFRSLSLFLPRQLLTPKLDTPEAGAIRRVPRKSPLVKLACTTLMNFYRALPSMTADEASRAVHPVVDLCATAVNGHAESPLARSALQNSLGTRVRRFIEMDLESPDLSVEKIEKRFRCSRTHLYRTFPTPGGIASYIRDRRLRRANQKMRDPRHAHRSVTDIAYELGFSSSTVFGRAFKRRFDMTPRDARCDVASPIASIESPRQTLHDWFSMM
jgi:AraC-like DNA-binding protein